MYTLTRTSDVYAQPLGFMARMQGTSQDVASKVVKFQVTHQYYLEDIDESKDLNPAKTTVEMSEYLINFNPATTTSSKLKLIGRKQLLLSDVAQFRRGITFDQLFILPYFDK